MALTKIPGSLLDTASGINGLIYPTSDGTSGQFLKTDGSGNLTFATVTTYTDSDVETYLDGGTSTPTFATATVSGTLTVTGDLDITGNVNSYNVTDLDVTDQTITLGAGQTEANSGGSGIIIDGSSASFLWNETDNRFDYNRNLHIGTAAGQGTSSSPALQIGGAATYRLGLYTDAEGGIIQNLNGDDGLQFRVKTAGEAMRIDGGTGNVGIGTDNPSSELHIKGASPAGIFNSQLLVDTTDTTGAENTGSKILFGYHDGVNNRTGPYIFGANTSGQSGHYSAYLAFGTRANGSNPEERMRIDASGNVGIGTTSPNVALDVDGGTANGSIARFHNENTRYLEISAESDGTYDDAISVFKKNSGVGQFAFKNSTTEYMRIDSTGIDVTGDITASQSMKIGTGGTYAAGSIYSDSAWGMIFRAKQASPSLANYRWADSSDAELMRIDSSGNAGIGQTSPNNNASFTSLSMGGTSGKSGLVEFNYSNDATKGYLYAQSTAISLEAASTNLIRFATNAAFRGAIDSKGTLFFGAGDSSLDHNTYAHAAVFSKNSTPLGTVVIEDMDVSSGIGNTVLNCYLRDQDPATYATFIRFTDGGGTVGSITHNDDGGGVTYNTTSDYRLKENVNYDWDALSLLNQLKPAKFNFIRNPSQTVQGFLAHEVKDIVPSSVQGEKDHMMDIGTITNSDGNVVYEGVYEHFCKTDEGQTWTRTGEEPLYQELDYSRIVPLLTKAIQEQQTIIENLQSRIEALEE